jgi:tRNA1Val (adenine37-N6)-methyltransferase
VSERFLGGRIVVRQPEAGFRAGLDAVMLAAAIPAVAGEPVLELGAGAGTASLCLAARIDCPINGLEIDPVLAALANENAAANGFHGRVHFIAGDAFDPPAELRRDFSHVFCNPPFHDVTGMASPEPARARALMDEGRLADWLAAGLKRTQSGGTYTCIIRADRMGEALAALPQNGMQVLPLWPRQGLAAKRIIIQVRKGSGAAFSLLPGLVLHQADGAYTPAADSILRHGAALALDSPRL